jgi:acetyl-CoA synthetase
MDQYGSSEFGLPVGNFGVVDMAVKPGSMGLPLPGSTVAVVDDDGREVAADVVGHVGMKPHPEGYYSLGYWNDAARDRETYRGEWMTVGDLARRDADGYFWFVGRSDDVIKSAGHLIGPFEVESALLEHPAVAEAGVIGKPDPVALETVKAFVSLKPGFVWSDALSRDLLGFARKRLGSAVAPKEIACLSSLPRTRSGKIMRRLLKARELGLPEGDISTLEGAVP